MMCSLSSFCANEALKLPRSHPFIEVNLCTHATDRSVSYNDTDRYVAGQVPVVECGNTSRGTGQICQRFEQADKRKN